MASLGGVRLDPQRGGAAERADPGAGAGRWCDPGGPRDDVRIGPHAARPTELRDGLEAAYRRWRATEADERRRWSLVDRANAVRRWTLR